MKKILITGAGGFVGTHLIHALKKAGEVEIFASVYKSTSDISALLPADHIIAGDLTDFAVTEKVISLSSPDVIYHLAAISVVSDDPNQTATVMNTNATLSFNLLESTRLHAPDARFISVCSANVYGLVDPAHLPIDESTPLKPLNAYAVSKITQEMLSLQYHLAFGLDIVMLRPFNHTGPGQTTQFLIPALAKQFVAIKKGAEAVIEVGNTTSSRDYTDVRDVVEAYILASEKGVAGQVYNIGSGHSYKTSEIIQMFEEITGTKVTIKEKDTLVRKSDVPILVADASKFSQLTGWKPNIGMLQTISDILDSYRNST
jgi:GDP-4-dehydro-6-deoxy-D-mannose reductase